MDVCVGRTDLACSTVWNASESSDRFIKETELMAPRKLRRGFAVMDRERVREIARKGGQAAHRKGTAHKWNETEAIEAGRKGGLARHQLRRSGHAQEPEPAPEEPERTTDHQFMESVRNEFAS
jgi:general stress protein YciG